jgi:hypothetical protein
MSFMSLPRPWLSGPNDRRTLKVGDRLDVKWANGNTSAHDFVKDPERGLGFWLNHQETKIWVDLALVEFRVIPMAKKRPPNPKPIPRNPNRNL